MGEVLLLFHLRTGRRRARAAAVAEALCLLHDCRPRALPGGPLAERGGIFWLVVPEQRLDDAAALLPRLGYSTEVDEAVPVPAGARRPGKAPGASAFRWQGVWWMPRPLYEEDPEELAGSAPDRRAFVLPDEGGPRVVHGYRGDGSALGRRALAPCDARLLVNLTQLRVGAVLLDPYAGAGGVVQEAVASGLLVLSADLDPFLGLGLKALGGRHCVADCRWLPFRDGRVGAVASEPPFAPEAAEAVVASLGEMARVVTPGGRISLLAASHQAPGLRAKGEDLGLPLLQDLPIDRKGTACQLLVWQRAP